jgi:protocatechuate 3,4-dioxygenase beta subunit
LRPMQWVTRGTRSLAAACLPTADATRGPLYRRGAPWRTRLCPSDEPGVPLSISGTITRSGDCQPIARATLDVWQTNARGLYSNLFGLDDPADPRAFNLRGRLMSDDSGRYQFGSILPGRYPLFWPLTRPRHIHLTVEHPQCETLTTQIFFEGDEYNHSDPWWRESLTIRLERITMPAAGRPGYGGVFNISLQPKNP